MGGFSRQITVTYGFVQANVKLTGSKAPDKDSDLVQVCATGHDPVKPTWDPYCSVCKTSVTRDSLKKASEPSKGNFVVFTPEEVATLKGDDDQYKGKIALTSSPVEQVEQQVMPNGTIYHLVPGAKDQFYGLLREMILDCPDLAFTGLYTVVSRASLYRVQPFRDALIAVQCMRPEEFVAAPEFTLPEIPQQMLDMAKDVAHKFAVDFDPTTYADTYKTKLAEAINVREATPGADIGAVAAATSVGGADPMAAMAAQMAALISAPPVPGAPTAKAAPAKRTRAKKDAAA